MKHNFIQSEFYVRKQPNILIPKFIYKVRREFYIYWEISRLARGLPKTFTYSNWDEHAKMMYHVNMGGNMEFEKQNFKEERIDQIDNPLLGPFIRRKDVIYENDKMLEEASRIAVYYKNINKRYDLDNYLHYKAITPMDWLRAAYYGFMTGTGLADRYRNQQFLSKPDFFYDFERRIINLNLQGPNQGKQFYDILTWTLKDIEKVRGWLDDYQERVEMKEKAKNIPIGDKTVSLFK